MKRKSDSSSGNLASNLEKTVVQKTGTIYSVLRSLVFMMLDANCIASKNIAFYPSFFRGEVLKHDF